MMKEAVEIAHRNNKKFMLRSMVCFIIIIRCFRRLHTFLHQIQVDRIIFGDPAVVMFVKTIKSYPFTLGCWSISNKLFPM